MESYAACFNEQALRLLKDLISLYPGDEDLLLFKSGFLVMSSDIIAPALAFKEHVAGPYGARILARDEAFFTNPEFADELQAQQDTDFRAVLSKLAAYWDAMHADDKDSVWTVLILLCRLSDKF